MLARTARLRSPRVSNFIPRWLLVALAAAIALGACATNNRGRNSECTFNGDCGGSLVCSAGYCRAPCASNADCSPNGTCILDSDPAKTVCAFPGDHALCTTSADCSTGRHCGASGLCTLNCSSDPMCASFAAGAVCLASGECGLAGTDAGVRDAGADVAMDAACATPRGMCSGSCVDLQSDTNHCGNCATQCTAAPANAQPACMSGACGFACATGFHLCAGACVSNTSLTSCGASCTPCAAVDHGTPTCDGVQCGAICDVGYHACGAQCADNTTVATCGNRCTPCDLPPHATSSCDGTSCAFACDPGYDRVGDVCRLPTPTLIGPTSTSTVTRHRPTFVVRRNSVVAAGVQVEIYRDRALTTLVDTLAGMAPPPTDGGPVVMNIGVAPTTALSPGVYYFRAASTDGTTVFSDYTPVWEFVVPVANTAHDTFFGSFPDPNGDGFADVLVGSNSGFAVYPGDASGLPTTPVATVTVPAGGTGAVVAQSASDVNGDGYGDVIAVRRGATQAWLYYGSSTGLDTSSPVSIAAMSVTIDQAIGVGDMDGDGYGELVLSFTGSHQTQAFAGSATGPTMTQYTYNMFARSIAAAGDVDGDRKADLAAKDPNASALELFGFPSTVAQGPKTMGSPMRTLLTVAAVGDVDGDGLADVAALESTQTDIMHAPPAGSNLIVFATVNSPAIAGAGDVNGDGYDDVIAIVPASRDAGSAVNAVLYAGGPGGPASSTTWTVTASGTVAAYLAGAGDVNRDGFDDVLLGSSTMQVQWFPGASGGLMTTAQTTLTDTAAGFGLSVAMRRDDARRRAAGCIEGG